MNGRKKSSALRGKRKMDSEKQPTWKELSALMYEERLNIVHYAAEDAVCWILRNYDLVKKEKPENEQQCSD